MVVDLDALFLRPTAATTYTPDFQLRDACLPLAVPGFSVWPDCESAQTESLPTGMMGTRPPASLNLMLIESHLLGLLLCHHLRGL